MMEIKRSIRSYLALQILITLIVCFGLGYILLISIDNYDYVPIQDFIYSVFTVYTQFGFIIFAVIVINTFNMDYREKNIMFYELLNYNAIKYFLYKFLTLIFWFISGTALLLFSICLFYKNFTYLLPSLNYFVSVIIYIVAVTSLCGFLFKNILMAFCLNLFIWIGSMFLATSIQSLNFVTYFDAANPVHQNFSKYLEGGNTKYLSYISNWTFVLGILIIIFILVSIFKRRWEKNGI